MAEENQVISCHTVEDWTEQFEKGKESKKLVVVDFMASRCGACRSIALVLAEFAKKTPTVIFLKVDVEELKLSPSRSGGGYGRSGAAEQIWTPTWACDGYELRQVVSRWLRSTLSCGGGNGLHSGASFAYTLIASWISEFSTFSGSGCCGFAGAVGRGFLGGGSPVVGYDLCVVCEFSSGYGRL
uniref:Thioredoxin domain-containing protein n=1 Tax=Fagus sylvatica TaxID=28930 RepID=A0A2N9FPF3_FAGSY